MSENQTKKDEVFRNTFFKETEDKSLKDAELENVAGGLPSLGAESTVIKVTKPSKGGASETHLA